MTLTPDTILAGTRVLAEFEGYEFHQTGSEKLPTDPDAIYANADDMGRFLQDFEYHTSYDSLHGAWRVFRSLDQTQFTEIHLSDFLQHRERLIRAFGYDSIEKCFSLLVDAVSWYVALKGGSHAV